MPKPRKQATAPSLPKANVRNSGTLDNTLSVLEQAISSSPAPSAAAITETLGLPRPTTNRMISNLVNLGLLRRDAKSRQLVEGDRLLKLALAALTQAAQRGHRHIILADLSMQTQETCNVGVIMNGQVQYLDRVESHWPLALRLEAGSTVPLYCSALGKLLLSCLPGAQQTSYLDAISYFSYTTNTLTSKRQLQAQLIDIAKQGYAIDNEEYLAGVIGIAVAVPLPEDCPPMGIAIAAPSARVSADELVNLLPLLNEAAKKLAASY